MLRKDIILLFIASILAQPASASVVIPPESYEISRSASNWLEREACLKPFNVPAGRIYGQRMVWPQKQAPYAVVHCAYHAIAADYKAFYVTICGKQLFHWRCEDPVLWLVSDFLGRGPFEIELEGLNLESGVAALSCLARGVDHHDVLNLRRRGVPRVLRRTRKEETSPEVIESFFEVPEDCAWIHMPLSCDMNGDVPISVAAQGCVE